LFARSLTTLYRLCFTCWEKDHARQPEGLKTDTVLGIDVIISSYLMQWLVPVESLTTNRAFSPTPGRFCSKTHQRTAEGFPRPPA
jgi:hypothetical protein